MAKKANQDQESTDMEDRNYAGTQQRPPRQDLRKTHAPNRDPDVDGEKMEKRDDLGGTSVYQKKTKSSEKGGEKKKTVGQEEEMEPTGTPSGRELTDFQPKKENLVALMKIESKLDVCLKFLSAAMSEFYALKSIDVSPDGRMGGRGYVMEMVEIRARLYQSVENISAVVDTVYDEVNGDHWKAMFEQHLPEVDAQLQSMEQQPEPSDDLTGENFEKVSSIMGHIKKVATKTREEALQVVQHAQTGNHDALRKLDRIVMNLRSQGKNYHQCAALLDLEVPDFEALMQDIEDMGE